MVRWKMTKDRDFYQQEIKNIYCPTTRKKCLKCDFEYVTKKWTANPLQAWRGPEGSRRLRLPDFKTIGT